MVVCAWSWLSVCGGSYSVMVVWDRFILVGGCCLWVLVVEGRVVVGDGGAVVVVFLIVLVCGVIVLKIAVNVACTVCACCISGCVVAPFVGNHHCCHCCC